MASARIVLLFFVSLTFFKDVAVTALAVTVPGETKCANRGDAVFRISYTLGSGESFNSVELRKGRWQNVFTAPAIVQGNFFVNGSFGGSYVSRGETNYYYGRTQFTITLRHVTPSDEGEYTVQMTRDSNIAVTPVVTQLIVDFLPGTPSISGAPTQPVIGGAGLTLLTCTANLGKPRASMVWSRRIGNFASTNITENVTITTTNNSDGTTSGTCRLTVYLDTADDGVQFRCQVFNRQATLSAETGAIRVKDAATVTVNGRRDIIAINGGSATFEILFTLAPWHTLHTFRVKKGRQIVFHAPAVVDGTYFRNGAFGDKYKSRGSTNFYFGRSAFNMTLSQVTLSDEGPYTVDVTRDNGVPVTPAITRLVVDFLPERPAISGIPSRPVTGGAGPTVLTCAANLGKPQSTMVWSRQITSSDSYTSIKKNVTSTITNNSDGTTSGTSTLTVYLDTDDDGVQFRCQVSNRHGSSYVETKTITVTEPRPVVDNSVQVCKMYTAECGSSFDYFFGDQVQLMCAVKFPSLDIPNPLPHAYRWQAVNSSDVIPGNFLLEIAVEPSVEYVCIVSNVVHGVEHTGSEKVTIRARDQPNQTESPPSTPFELVPPESLSGGAIAGIVVGVLLVVVVISMLIVAKRRGVTFPGINRKSTAPKISHQKEVVTRSVEPDGGYVEPSVPAVDYRCDEDASYSDMNGPSYELAENIASEQQKETYVNVRVPFYEGLTDVRHGDAAEYTQLAVRNSSRNVSEYETVVPSRRT